MTALLITGTDTGVGKTLVTAALAAGLAARGVRVGVAKPVETGCGPAGPADALALAGAVGDPSPPLDLLCPHRFPEPLAPALAAERAGRTIDVDALAAGLRARARAYDVLLIEGAGGLLVPLAGRVSYADLARTLAAPVLLVVGSRLGAINHALLTLEALAHRAIPIVGYVMNRIVEAGDPAGDSNAWLLAEQTAVSCLGELPWVSEAASMLEALRTGGRAAAEARVRLAGLAAGLDLAAVLATAGPTPPGHSAARRAAS